MTFLTKLEGFVCHICSMRKKDVNEVWCVKYYSKCQNGNKVVDISTPLPYSLYIERGRILLQVSGKDAWKQVMNFRL